MEAPTPYEFATLVRPRPPPAAADGLPPAGLPTAGHAGRIDWEHLLKRRRAVLDHARLPPYLLLPEVRDLLALTLHSNHHLLLSTLWHTGARISEALTLTPKSFCLDEKDAYVSLTTLKKRGRPRGGVQSPAARMVPLRDPVYLRDLQRYLTTHKLRVTDRLFDVTRQAVDLRLRKLAQDYRAHHGAALSVDLSAHTFRHSFAVNAVLHGVPLTVLQAWLGHSNLQTTAIYTQVLTSETGHLMASVEF
ncbi:MAG: site-specific integrase [Pseudomonadota bacterium]